MKNLIKASFFIVVATLLFSSCNSKLSLTKRHYNRGYYVSHNKGKTTGDKQSENKHTYKHKPKFDYTSNLKKSEEPSSTIYSGKDRPSSSTIILAKTSKKENQSLNITQTKKFKPLVIKKPLLQVKPKFSELKKVSARHVEGDAYSLFWIIILVLLMIWLIGFLAGGIGGFIHLLLLIALILFILWLLRIL